MRLSVQRVGEMVKKELRQLLRDPRTRAMIFVSPVIQLILFGYAVNTDIPNTATFVIDHDRSAESRDLIDAFRATGYFRITGTSQRPADLVSALDRGDAVLGLEIPAGFAATLQTDKPATVQILLDGTHSNTATVAQGYAQRIVQRYATGVGAVGGRPSPGRIDARIRAWYNPNLESRDYNVPAVIGLLLMMMCLILTALAVVRERETGTLDQLLVSPLTPAELLLSKTLPAALVGLIDLATISVIAIVWFDIPFRGSVFALVPAAALFILAGLAVGLLISTVSRTQQEAFMSMFLFLLPAIILSGFFYPISSMPELFQYLTLLNPVRHFMEIVRAIFLKGQSALGLWPQFAALALIGVGSMRLAVSRFARMTVS